jgi:CheY-like chemotaxis protein
MTTTANATSELPRHPILVIDDGADNRMLLSATLQRAGYEPLLAEHGEAGLAILAKRTPALILLDYSMPGLSGPEVARRIRSSPATAHTPIILLTASSDETHIEEAFAAGADDYIIKPFERRIMLARIASMIRARADRSDLQSASRVQQEQVTRLPLKAAGCVLSGAVVSCTHVGGDLVQVVDGRNGSVVAIVLDISGHGTAAAIVAAGAVSEMRSLLQTHSAVDAMGHLSATLAATHSNHYACVCAIELTQDRATIVNAGLPPVCLIREGRIVSTVLAAGTPPGMFSSATYTAETVALLPGDRLVVVSDGLTEPFGLADDMSTCVIGLDLLMPPVARTTEELTTSIRRVLGDRELEDDATILIIDREVQK